MFGKWKPRGRICKMWLVPGTMSLYSDRFQLKNAALLELYFVKLAFVCLLLSRYLCLDDKI